MPKFTRDTIDGSITINFKKRGRRGDAVFLIHGVGGDLESWMLQTGPISKADFTVYTYDVRGFGNSTKIEFPDDELKASSFYSLKNDAADLIALMDHLNVKKAHLVGMSMGGYIAQITTILYPERVISLTISNSWSYPHARFIRAIQAWSLAVDNLTMEECFDIMLPWVMAEKSFEIPMIDRMLEPSKKRFIENNSNWCFSNKIKTGIIEAPTYNERIKEIKCPVLIIGGSDDLVAPPKYQEYTKTQIPQAEIIIVPDVGHQLKDENTKVFNKTVIEFLEKNSIEMVE
jgi:pimeloyl-ACP methyl ester carboxylesterase